MESESPSAISAIVFIVVFTTVITGIIVWLVRKAKSGEAIVVKPCVYCGTPALPIALMTTIGILIISTIKVNRFFVCVQHETEVYRPAQRFVLLLGWWSWMGIFFAPFALILNRASLNAHRKAIHQMATHTGPFINRPDLAPSIEQTNNPNTPS